MTIDKVILLVLDAAGGTVPGKTLLQKRIYFLSILLDQEWNFSPHFYGPFSPDLEEGIEHNKSLGFLDEARIGFGVGDDLGFEKRRYDYNLTEDGKRMISFIAEKESSEYNQIKEILKKMVDSGDNDDYVSLSIAAKTCYIVKAQQCALSLEDIRTEARSLGWDITSEQIDKAVSFLEKMGLATRRSN